VAAHDLALRHHDQPARYVIGRVLMATGLSPLVRLPQDGFRLRFYTSSIPLGLWLAPRNHVNHVERFFRCYLKPGDTVVDVGANIGLYTMIAATCVGPAGRVYAIEPSPQTAEYLRGNVALNRSTNVTVHNVALGETAGSIRLSNESQDDQNRVVDSGDGHEVALVRLDQLPIDDAEIALLKIDVEGYEKFVPDGASGLLPRVQCIFIETWELHFEKYGYSCGDVHERLRGNGFRLFRIVADQLMPVEPGYISMRCEDVIAVRDAADFSRRTGYRVQ